MPRFTEVPSFLGKNSRNAKTIYQLLKIAKDTEESIFQRNKEYMKLKTKKINLNEIDFVLSGLYNMKNPEIGLDIGDRRDPKLYPSVTRYPEESIYWNLRALNENVCDKETRYNHYNELIHLYDDNKEYELALEYGKSAQTWLESLESNNDVNIYVNDCTMYDCLGHAASELKRYEEAKKHYKIRLKYTLKRHKDGNGKPLQQWELLYHYKDYIETQLRCNCFQEAMNTFKKIKYFKLDSMNPKDVEDYMGSFNSSFNEDQDDINLIYRTLQTVASKALVASLCEQKCRALHGLGDLTNCKLWSRLPICTSDQLTEIFYSYGGPSEGLDSFLVNFIHTTLTISACDYSRRTTNFHLLMCYLFSNPKHASYYISMAMRQLHTKLDDILPFLEHFIGTCNDKYVDDIKKVLKQRKNQNEIRSDINLKEDKKKMIAFRNSLMIMNRFKPLT